MKNILRCFYLLIFCSALTAHPALAAGKICPQGGESHPAEFSFCPTHGVKLDAVVDATPPKPACKVNDKDIAQSYSGGCVNGLADGEGTASGRDKYVGSFRNGNKEGRGVYTWASGDRFDGTFAEDRRLIGVFTWADGAEYKGSWLQGQRTGFGVMTWASGSKYAGFWSDGKRDGYGIYLSADDIKNNIPLSKRYALWKDDQIIDYIDLDYDDTYDELIGEERKPQLLRFMEDDAFRRCSRALGK